MVSRALIGVCVLAIAGWTSPTFARQDDERLDPLFQQLLTAPTAAQAESLIESIWDIWYQSGDEAVDRLMQHGLFATRTGNLELALLSFTAVVEMDPEFAEGWNRRATVYWLLDDLQASLDDIQRTLALEPRHFGAIFGMGLIFMQTGDSDGALHAFEQIRAINPQDIDAQRRIEELHKRLSEDGV